MLEVLLPCDGSENSLRAVEFVIKLRQKGTDLRVSLVHVHEEPALYGELAVYMTREKVESLQASLDEAALAPAQRALEAAGVPHTRETLVGSAAQRIVEHAHDRGMDMVVMGTRGAGSLANLLLGSVAHRVVHLATVPVTLVK